MTDNDFKSLALKQCIDIYGDYDECEVMKFAPPSVQKAWEVGKEYMDSAREAEHEIYGMENYY
jgi:hypothetical protein